MGRAPAATKIGVCPPSLSQPVFDCLSIFISLARCVSFNLSLSLSGTRGGVCCTCIITLPDAARGGRVHRAVASQQVRSLQGAARSLPAMEPRRPQRVRAMRGSTSCFRESNRALTATPPHQAPSVSGRCACAVATSSGARSAWITATSRGVPRPSRAAPACSTYAPLLPGPCFSDFRHGCSRPFGSRNPLGPKLLARRDPYILDLRK